MASIKAKESVTSDQNGTIAPPVDINVCSWDFCIRNYESAHAVGSTILQPAFAHEAVHFNDNIEVEDENGNVMELKEVEDEFEEGR